MLNTPLAMLRRASTCPRLNELATRLGVRPQRLSAVEAGRIEVSEDFLAKLAKALACPLDVVTGAYLQGRRQHLRAEVREVEAQLVARRSQAAGRRRAS